jgi:hypothetical protein
MTLQRIASWAHSLRWQLVVPVAIDSAALSEQFHELIKTRQETRPMLRITLSGRATMHAQQLKHLARVVPSAAATTLVAILACVCGSARAEPSPTQAYYDFVHWVSVGRADRALAQFADDAVVVAGPACSSLEPCIGKAAIRDRYMSALRHRQVPLPLSDQRFDGRHLRTCGDTVNGTARRGASMPSFGGHEIELTDGRIAALRFEPTHCSVSWETFESGRRTQSLKRELLDANQEGL